MKRNTTIHVLKHRNEIFKFYSKSFSTSLIFSTIHRRSVGSNIIKFSPQLEKTLPELKHVSDLTQPHYWYPIARAIKRRVIFHAGPTNSGKTYEALQRFKASKSGVYCGPLRLLAAEVFRRMNAEEHRCDLLTGEDRKFAIDSSTPSNHLSCTVEMLRVDKKVEVVVIDEIQMLRDDNRGWAWTRALLGAAADEIHLCGEKSAVPIVRRLLSTIGEDVIVQEYERKSKLVLSTHSLRDVGNVQPGDCIVAFSKRKIYEIARNLEKKGVQCAMIYGDLPPDTKLLQSESFNNPKNPTKVLVATDAIGMGLNLNISRIIFDSLKRPISKNWLTAAHVKQIAGRAGRFSSQYSKGEVLTLHNVDMPILGRLLQERIPDIQQAGIAPTADMLETFSFYLPKATFVELLSIFQSVCQLSNDFFLSQFDQVMERAKLIDDIPLPLNIRYIFCKVPFDTTTNRQACSVFTKMARIFSQGRLITWDWLQYNIHLPSSPPRMMQDFGAYEQVYGVLDCYLWLSMRFDEFCDSEKVREEQNKLAYMINEGIKFVLNREKVGEEFDSNFTEKISISTEKMSTEKMSPLEIKNAVLSMKKRRCANK